MNDELSKTTKCCSTCNKIKPLSEFYKGKNYKDGYRGQCKVCMDFNVKKYKESGIYYKWRKKWYENHRPEQLDLMIEYNYNRRIQAIRHYGGDPPKCVCCGETIFDFLTLDHKYNDGAEYRRKISGRISGWIIKNNFPPIFQVLCWNCNSGKLTNNGTCPHQKKAKKENSILKNDIKRVKILNHYGGDPPKCACCGETTFEFLTIDHIHNDGAEHRRQLNLHGPKIQNWIIRNSFPDGFQVLCWNCNWGKQANNGICPHVEIKNHKIL